MNLAILTFLTCLVDQEMTGNTEDSGHSDLKLMEAVWRAVSAVKEEPVERMADLEGMIAGQENATDQELARGVEDPASTELMRTTVHQEAVVMTVEVPLF